MTEAVCIKVSNLRKLGYEDLQEWMLDPNNLYVGRTGRIFISDKNTKEKRAFHYQGSKWANPYPLSKHSLEESLKLYKEHLYRTGLIQQIGELQGLYLGCFCDQSKPCHAQILANLSNVPKTICK